MADKTQEKIIEEKIIEILKSSNMDETSEAKVRKLASEQLGLDLSQPDYKKIVRSVVNAYLVKILEDQENQEDEEEEKVEKVEQEDEVAEEEEKDEEGERGESAKAKEYEYDDSGGLIICRVSSKRRVTWSEFKGKKYLSIREYYEKDGKELPSAKGITLTAEQWACLKENVPAIEEAIKKGSSS